MKQFFQKTLKSSFSIVSVIVVIICWTAVSYFVVNTSIEFYGSEDGEENAPIESVDNTKESCNVFGIRLYGEVVTYFGLDLFDSEGNLTVSQTSSGEVRSIIKKADDDDTVKYVVVEIDSPGGSPVAGLEIMNALKKSKKPVVVLGRGIMASAAYMGATGAQTIFASPFTEVGSIGVTASYLDNTAKNKKDGLTYVDLSVGKYKDTFNPDRPLTSDEKILIMRDVNLIHEGFIKTVAENRKLDIVKVRQLADGSTMLGEAAVKNGLIDRIGDMYDVESFLEEKIGKKADICWQN